MTAKSETRNAIHQLSNHSNQTRKKMTKRLMINEFEVEEEVKRHAIVWGLKEYQDQKRRQEMMAKRGQPIRRCRLCLADHPTYECTVIKQGDKMEKAKKAGVCLLCLGTGNHLATQLS